MYDPLGILFVDLLSRQEMKLVTEGPMKGWIVYKHPDGQWVTLRKATQKDLGKLVNAGQTPLN